MNHHRNAWHAHGTKTAIAAAIAIMGLVGSLDAYALALGRINVLSALGEPLRAEIDIADMTAEEGTSLKVAIARAEVFKASGLEFTAIAANVDVSLQRRANGRPFFRLTSSNPVNEPFVDLVVEATWATGRITRDYTMLLDPPVARPSANLNTAPIQVAPQLAPQRPAAVPMPAPTRPLAAAPAPIARPIPAPAPVAAAPATRPDTSAGTAAGQQLTVQKGDTAGKIAARIKPESISLDQMLVALLRSNPDAFIGGNINRIRAGAVVAVPSAEAASAIAPAEARQTIALQSQNFNAFRSKLAQTAPAVASATPDRQVGGKVQAKVEDRTAASSTPDKLTLSQGAVQGKSTAAAGTAATGKPATAAEDKIAQDRQAKAEATRVAELSKNISELNKLGAASAPVASAAAAASAAVASAAKAPAVPGIAIATPAAPAGLPAAAVVPTPAPTPAPAASVPAASTAAAIAAPASVPAPAVAVPDAAASAAAAASVAAASAPLAGASAPDASAVVAASAPALPVVAAAPTPPPSPPPPPPPPKVVTPAPAPAPTSFIDDLLENPLVLPIVGLLLALLAGLGFYQYRKNKAATNEEDRGGLDSRLQADSFFGASGGQRIDTSEGPAATGSSLVYSPSQLDAAGDVDPVAEADVYLAYGRDLQAEEILKEALRTTPARAAIHAKLLEIYAKRRDVKAFETLAGDAYNLTQGQGPEWAYIAEMGRELDPDNPAYQANGRPAGARSLAAAAAVAAVVDKNRPDAPTAWKGTGHHQSTIPAPLQVSSPAPGRGANSASDLDLDLDFSLDDVDPPAPAPAPARPPLAPAASMAPVTPIVAASAAAPAALPPLDMGLDMGMDFNSSDATAFTLPSATTPKSTASFAPPASSSSNNNNNNNNSSSSSSDDIDFFAKGLDFTPEPLPMAGAANAKKAPSPPPPAPAPADNSFDMMDFDMGALSLDLESQASTPAPEASSSSKNNQNPGEEDALETKFLLAEEFRSLGDDETARAFAEEVLASNPGAALRSKTQAFLNSLS